MKKLISILLALVMLLSLMPMAVMADDEETQTRNPVIELYVGTVNALETPQGDGWSFDAGSGVLTLNNCTLADSMLHIETDEYGSARYDAMIYVKGDLTIELIGTNSVERVIEEAPTDYTSYYAIFNSTYTPSDSEMPGSLTFTGSGNLTTGIAVTGDSLSEDGWGMNEAWEFFEFSAGIGSWGGTYLNGLQRGGWMDIYGGIYGVEAPSIVKAFANYPTFGDNCIVTAYRDVEGTIENEYGYNWNNNDAWRMKVTTGDAALQSNGRLILMDSGNASGEGWTWGDSILTLSEGTEVKAVEFRRTVGNARLVLTGNVALDATDMGYDANWNAIPAVGAYCDLEIDAAEYSLTLYNGGGDDIRAEMCDVTVSGGTVVSNSESGYAINMIAGDLTIGNATFRSANEIYSTEGYDADSNTIPAGDVVLDGAVVVLDSPITSYGSVSILDSDVTITQGYEALYGSTAVTVQDSDLSLTAGGYALKSDGKVTIDNCNLNLTAENCVIYHGYYHYEGNDEGNIPDVTWFLLQNMDITQPESWSVQLNQTDYDYCTKYEVQVVDGDGNPATTLVATAAGNEHEHSYENGICSCGAKQTFTVTWANWDGTVLETDTVEYGTVPTYDGETPTRPNVGWDFRFYGWGLSASGAEVTPGAATKDVTYYAKYTSTVHKHDLIFLDDDGVTELGRYEINYSKYISASWLSTAAGKPTKACCTLAGWTYADGSAVESFYMPDHDVVFVAVWDGPNHTDTDDDGDHTCDVCGTENVSDHSYNAVITAPTCEDDGYTTYTCGNCGDSYTADYVDSLGHAYESEITVQPGCESVGERTYTCGNCGDTYTEEIAAAGHSYEAVVTPPTCEDDGYTTYTCGNCGDSYTADVVAANGHSYVDGTCTVCGGADPDYVPIVQPTIQLRYPSLTFESEVYMNLYFVLSNTDDVVQVGMIRSDDAVAEVTDELVDGFEVKTSGSYTIVRSPGIPAKELGESKYIGVYAKLTDGSYVFTKLNSYSALAYAKDRLANSTNENLKKLCVAMLNYGAAAQTYMNYNVDALANASLTADQLAMVEAYKADMVAGVTAVDSSKVGIFTRSGFGSCYPSVSFEGAFAISYYFAPSNAPENGMKLYYWELDTYNAVETLTKENATGVVDMTASGSAYKGTVSGIAAKEIDKTIFVAGVYEVDGTTYSTGILNYSLGAYCVDRIAKGSANMQALAAATAVYGYYAKIYFAG